jgi:GDP-L-fucose synthase
VLINCAAFVGGIKFGLEQEGEIFYNNILMNTNLMECARRYDVKRVINPISNCSYPDVIDKDFKEEEWWNGPLHPSVLAYGFARKASWVQSYAYHNQYGMDFINLLLPNMYGPEDHFDEERSHALGALIMKTVRAKEKNLPQVTIWGTGRPVREWLYVDDCVEVFVRSLEIPLVIEPINIGRGEGISIARLAKMIKEIVGYKGKLVFDTSRPDGAPYKVMNVEKMKEIFDWAPPTKLEEGIKKTVNWYYKNIIRK